MEESFSIEYKEETKSCKIELVLSQANALAVLKTLCTGNNPHAAVVYQHVKNADGDFNAKYQIGVNFAP
jgi:hypothetical protein